MKIAITGSGGWLARSAFAAIKRLQTEGFELEAVMISSIRQKIVVSQYGWYETRTMSEYTNEQFDLFVPLAFLTQEKFNLLGEKYFRDSNLAIINSDLDLLRQQKNIKVLLISSGVVQQASKLQESNPSYLAYAELKKYQEKILRQNISESNFSLCYLYSCISIDLPNWENYAFSSIVHDAIYRDMILINNPNPVYRKYVDARILFYVMFKELYLSGNFTISSSGALIEIEELANKAIKVLDSKAIIKRSQAKSDGLDDLYYSTDNTMDELFSKHNETIASIEELIRMTTKIFVD